MVDLAKQTLNVASITTVMALVSVAAALLYAGWPRAARRWLTAVVLGYWLMATPACVSWIQAPLVRGYQPLPSSAAAEGARVIVLLSGGTESYGVSGTTLAVVNDPSAFRSIEAARVYRMLGGGTIIASGGRANTEQQVAESAALRDALVSLGVPARDIVLESESTTTHTQVMRLRPMLDAMRADRFVLVTSPPHMRRSMAAFIAAGLHPIASISAQTSDFDRSWFQPSDRALSLANAAIYDYAALGYYWSRGWLAPSR